MSDITWDEFFDRLLDDFHKTPEQIESAIRAMNDVEGMSLAEVEQRIAHLHRKVAARAKLQ